MGFFSQLYRFMGLGTLFESTPRQPTQQRKNAIDSSSYWQGRDVTFTEELTSEIRQNARELMLRVNLMLAELNVASAKVISGWRPRAVNTGIGGAPNSYHISGKAVDLRDNASQDFAQLILDNSHLLHKYQLWLENPQFTRGQHSNWIHLDIGQRPDRELRVFNP